MVKPWNVLERSDPKIFELIEKERNRQESGIELIASENFASQAVLSAAANVLTNKYAEGLPAKRYYGGCEFVDTVEEIAIKRACEIFGCKFANVQPHSGAQANAAVYLTLLSPGDRILGLDLNHGGHLTHGSKVNFSGTYFEPHFYGVSQESQTFDYDQIRKTALKVKPKLIVAGASAYPRIIDFGKFRSICDEVGALLMVDMAHIAGLVAAGVHPSPLPHADVVTTTTHKTLRGPRGGLILWNEEKYTKELNKGVFPGTQGGPLEHIIAAKAVCFKEALSDEFKAYQRQVVENAGSLAQALVDCGFKLVSGGTDNHLVLMDFSDTDVTGKQMEEALQSVHITTNKNTVPNEQRSPFVTSGIRLGTPAVTTRGFKRTEMLKIAAWIQGVYGNLNNPNVLSEISSEVTLLAKEFPVYREWL